MGENKTLIITAVGRHSVVPARAYADTRLTPGDIHILGQVSWRAPRKVVHVQ